MNLKEKDKKYLVKLLLLFALLSLKDGKKGFQEQNVGLSDNIFLSAHNTASGAHFQS